MRLVQFKKPIKGLCVVLSIVCVASSAFVAEAKNTDAEIDKINNRIEQNEKELKSISKEKQNTEEYVGKLMANIETVQDKVDALQDQKASLQKEIDAIQKKIDDTNKEIEKSQREIEVKQAEMEKTFEEYSQRLRAMYVSGNVSTLEVFLEGGDLSSVLTRAQMVKSVSEQDSKTLNALLDKMEEIRQEKQELENKKLELDGDKKNLDDRKAKLQASLDEINKTKTQLSNEIDNCNSKIKSLSSKSSSIKNLIEKDQDKVAQLERELQNASNSNNGSDYKPGTGQLAYPTSVRTISAGYPRYPSGAYHSGVDFACPMGTSVYASDGGYVAVVKYLNYSYGYHILINHGNGISTLYAHNSKILVSQGQTVTKGQKIAETGSTGNSTGPHLHFEVRKNGNPVNPLSYLR